LGNTTKDLQKRLERLSSGKRINRAADDAAGLGIAEGLRSDIRSLVQSRRNTNDAVSMIQVAEGGLEEVTNILVRLKELSIQAASDTIGRREREYLNLEFMQLKDEVERIALSTEYNGTRLLAGQTREPEELFEGHNPFPLEFQVDKDYYEDVDSLEQPNPLNVIRAHFEKMNATVQGEGSLNIGDSQNPDGLRVDSKEEAQRTIATVESALTTVAGYRASLGALQNRLESASRTLSIREESLSEARSRIMDADFAAETALLTQQTILQQAGASVLSQAAQAPKIALSLIQAQ